MKKKIIFHLLFLPCFLLFSQDLHHNPWSLIIYRSENDSSLNNIRLFVKITDEEEKDAFAGKIKAYYEWVSIPGYLCKYQKKPYLSGGMAMHLNLKKGKYKISVYTPEEELLYFSGSAKEKWESNIFYYDTENPAKVIFVYPKMNENGFYSGEWLISAKAPSWFKFTKPVK